VAGLALISDIHGNCVALDAVLADLSRHQVADLICLGDIAAGGPQPREVISCLRKLGCRAVRGNGERWLLEGLPPGQSEETKRLAEVARWTRDQLAVADLDYLAALPATLTVTLGSLTLFCFHGSPRSDIESLLATTREEELNEVLAAAPAARVLAGGHTHLQLLRAWDDRLLINPGSVGLPLDSVADASAPLPGRAEYAIVEVEDGAVEVAFRHLSVDVDAVAAATAAMPHRSWAADLERRIRRWNARSVR
jgi:predicted phosphodiesterase